MKLSNTSDCSNMYHGVMDSTSKVLARMEQHGLAAVYDPCMWEGI